MKRRTYLATVGAGIASIAGCTALADATRLDLAADSSRIRGKGDPVTTSRTIDQDGIKYVAETDQVRYVSLYGTDGPTKYRTEPFERWARTRCVSEASTAVLPAIEDRLGKPPEGVGKGVRGLLFGLVIEVDHILTLAEDGSIERKPNVRFDELIAIAPPSVKSTVRLSGREHTRDVPVVLRHVETQEPEPLFVSTDEINSSG